MSDPNQQCTSCYGTGEVVTERGAAACPDCFGEGRPLGHGARVEWHLRELDRRCASTDHELNADVQWLVHEVRKLRETLVRILTLCHDGDDGDTLARDIKFQANEALGIYSPET